MKVNVKAEMRLGNVHLFSLVSHNLVVDAGRNLIAQIVHTTGATKPSHFAIGDDATPVLPADTVLANELGLARVAIATQTVLGNDLKYEVTITNTTGGDLIVRESGIFNASTAGTMLARWLFSTFTFPDTATLTLSWTVTFGD